MGQPQAEGGVRRGIEVQRGIGAQVAVPHLVHVGALVLVVQHRAGAQRAGFVQRAAGIDAGAVVVPGAGAAFHHQPAFGRASLAHQIHRAGRAAGAFQQALGATQHFHSVEMDGTGLQHVAVGVGARQRHAVVLDGVGLETADDDVVATAHTPAQGDAGGVGEYVFQRVQSLVVHPLAGDDGDGLGSLLQRLHPFHDARTPCSVAARAFADGTALHAGGDRHGRQRRFSLPCRQLAQGVFVAASIHRFQSRACKQRAQGRVDAVLTAQTLAAVPRGEAGVDRKLDAGLAGELEQGAGECS